MSYKFVNTDESVLSNLYLRMRVMSALYNFFQAFQRFKGQCDIFMQDRGISAMLDLSMGGWPQLPSLHLYCAMSMFERYN